MIAVEKKFSVLRLMSRRRISIAILGFNMYFKNKLYLICDIFMVGIEFYDFYDDYGIWIQILWAELII